MNEYNWAVYIDGAFANSQQDKEYTKSCADFLGWKYEELKGDPALMHKLLEGQWNEDEFLIVKPGQKINEDLTNEGLIKAE